jgi:hypothetical protein
MSHANVPCVFVERSDYNFNCESNCDSELPWPNEKQRLLRPHLHPYFT